MITIITIVTIIQW